MVQISIKYHGISMNRGQMMLLSGEDNELLVQRIKEMHIFSKNCGVLM